MKKRIASLLLALPLCLTLLPTTALAEDEAASDRTVIATVEDLQQFARAVDAGDYDGKTDAVVELAADLDLTGIEWTPIGSTVNADGEVEHCFSGKFYGNGHTVSNLDLSDVYGATVLCGFFGDIENAEISSLTVQGTINVNSEREYTYYGAIAGFAGGCTIFDCTADVSFTNNENLVYGMIGLCGQASDTVIDYCRNTGDLLLTGDAGSLYAGGIVGFADGDSEIRYTTTECNRWGDGVKGKFIEIADATTTVYTDTVITGWGREGNEIKETYTDPNDVTQAYAIGKAYDGGQFAELNCQAYGALYQDVLTVPGATLNWSLAHAGRDGTDTMALLIAPVDVAQDITDALKNKTTRAAIQEALNGSITVNGVNVPIRNYIVDGNISDGCTAWGVHNGTYTVPAGQYVSRFFFVAVASASGDSEEGLKRGNPIDRVWFSTDPVPPVAGSGILRVTKTLLKTDGTALTDAELIQAKENLHFTVVNSDRQIVGDFSGSTMQADSINPNVLQYTLELPLADSSGNTYNYAVTETARGEPTGYDCTLVRTVKDGGVWTDVTDTPIHSGIALTAQAATNIRFENTYARATGSLTITKQLPDDADDALQADFAETVNTFTIASVAAGSYTPQYSAGARPADAPAAVSPDSNGRLTLSIKGAGSVTLPGLAPAGYTVTESAAPNLTNYYLTTPTADRTQSLDVTAGGTAEAHFTNTYEPYLSVTITKKVVGDMGDTTKNFSFTATLDTTQIRQGSAYTTAGDGAALTDTGFTLRSGGSVTLTHLRADQTLTLTETDPGDHTVSWQLNGDDGPTGVTCTLQVPRAQPAEITCINTRNVGIPTGLHTGAAPYLALVGLCWLGWRLLRCREV